MTARVSGERPEAAVMVETVTSPTQASDGPTRLEQATKHTVFSSTNAVHLAMQPTKHTLMLAK